MIVPVYTAAISYSTHEDQTEYAAAAYRIPSKGSMSSFTLFNQGNSNSQCQLLPYSFAIESYMPSLSVIANYTAVGAFLALGYVHPQNHSGNRYLEVEHTPEGTPIGLTGVLTDMEDVYSVSDYPKYKKYTNSSTLENNRTDFKISPYGKAILYMLCKAIESDIRQLTMKYYNKSEIDEKHAAAELFKNLFDPAERGFILGYQLAIGKVSRTDPSILGHIQSFERRDTGIVMNGLRLLLVSEVGKLFRAISKYNRLLDEASETSGRRKKLRDEIDVISLTIGTVVAKDIVKQFNPKLIVEDPFVSEIVGKQRLEMAFQKELKKRKTRNRHRGRRQNS